MSNTITNSQFNFPGQQKVYHGKVREVYTLENDILLMIASDRLSAFDVVMPKGIPYKGQILNQIATQMMRNTEDLVPNWLIATPDPNVAIGYACEPFKVEMVIRGYMSGHAAREYKLGKRILCGVEMPEGMIENDKFPSPIITPATKAEMGDHDEDISREEIIAQGIVAETEYLKLEEYTKALFQRGNEMASDRDLILVDTKYEFGKDEFGVITLIDEIHTPDSSRYFYKEDYSERQAKNEKQKQLSKEFVREWLMENGFEGLEGQEMPKMPESFVQLVSDRYIELYEKITGKPFERASISIIDQRVEENVSRWLQNNK